MNQNKDSEAHGFKITPLRAAVAGPFTEPTRYEIGHVDVKALLEQQEKEEKEEREDNTLKLAQTSSISFDRHSVYSTMKHNIGGQSKEWKTAREEFPEWLNNIPRKTVLMTREAFDKIDWVAVHPIENKNHSLLKLEKSWPVRDLSIPVVAIAEAALKNRKIAADISSIVFILDVPGESFAISGELVDIVMRRDAFTYEPVRGPEFHVTGLDEESLWQKNSFAFTDVKGHSYVFSRRDADFTVIF